MKYKFTVLLGIAFGAAINILLYSVSSGIFVRFDIGARIALGAAFACCGCLLGYVIDKKH